MQRAVAERCTPITGNVNHRQKRSDLKNEIKWHVLSVGPEAIRHTLNTGIICRGPGNDVVKGCAERALRGNIYDKQRRYYCACHHIVRQRGGIETPPVSERQ